MVVFSKELYQKRLNTQMKAEETVAAGQSYQVGSRVLIRVDLKQVREKMEYQAGKLVEASTEGKHGGRNRSCWTMACDL